MMEDDLWGWKVSQKSQICVDSCLRSLNCLKERLVLGLTHKPWPAQKLLLSLTPQSQPIWSWCTCSHRGKHELHQHSCIYLWVARDTKIPSIIDHNIRAS